MSDESAWSREDRDRGFLVVAEAFGPDHVLALGRRQPVGNTVISPLIKCLGTGASQAPSRFSVVAWIVNDWGKEHLRFTARCPVHTCTSRPRAPICRAAVRIEPTPLGRVEGPPHAQCPRVSRSRSGFDRSLNDDATVLHRRRDSVPYRPVSEI